MITEQLISPIVPILQATDTGNDALLKMEENHLSQLPLVIDEKYSALVSESDLLDWDTPESPLSAAKFLNYRPAVFAAGHPYEALRLASSHNLSIVPIVDAENVYMGSITRNELLKYMAETSGLDNPGGIIVLEILPTNYSMSEIARICESEEVLIINSQLFSNKETGNFEMTIKTNRTNLDGVVNALERHNYKIKEMYGEQSSKEYIIDRYNELMNYLNM